MSVRLTLAAVVVVLLGIIVADAPPTTEGVLTRENDGRSAISVSRADDQGVRCFTPGTPCEVLRVVSIDHVLIRVDGVEYVAGKSVVRYK